MKFSNFLKLVDDLGVSMLPGYNSSYAHNEILSSLKTVAVEWLIKDLKDA